MATYTHGIHKDAYKLAASTIWLANDMMGIGLTREGYRAASIARRQAGRILSVIGTDDDTLNAALAKYENGATDFVCGTA